MVLEAHCEYHKKNGRQLCKKHADPNNTNNDKQCQKWLSKARRCRLDPNLLKEPPRAIRNQQRKEENKNKKSPVKKVRRQKLKQKTPTPTPVKRKPSAAKPEKKEKGKGKSSPSPKPAQAAKPASASAPKPKPAPSTPKKQPSPKPPAATKKSPPPTKKSPAATKPKPPPTPKKSPQKRAADHNDDEQPSAKRAKHTPPKAKADTGDQRNGGQKEKESVLLALNMIPAKLEQWKRTGIVDLFRSSLIAHMPKPKTPEPLSSPDSDTYVAIEGTNQRGLIGPVIKELGGKGLNSLCKTVRVVIPPYLDNPEGHVTVAAHSALRLPYAGHTASSPAVNEFGNLYTELGDRSYHVKTLRKAPIFGAGVRYAILGQAKSLRTEDLDLWFVHAPGVNLASTDSADLKWIRDHIEKCQCTSDDDKTKAFIDAFAFLAGITFANIQAAVLHIHQQVKNPNGYAIQFNYIGFANIGQYLADHVFKNKLSDTHIKSAVETVTQRFKNTANLIRMKLDLTRRKGDKAHSPFVATKAVWPDEADGGDNFTAVGIGEQEKRTVIIINEWNDPEMIGGALAQDNCATLASQAIAGGSVMKISPRTTSAVKDTAKLYNGDGPPQKGWQVLSTAYFHNPIFNVDALLKNYVVSDGSKEFDKFLSQNHGSTEKYWWNQVFFTENKDKIDLFHKVK